jgi:excisionase family DNA binding protein
MSTMESKLEAWLKYVAKQEEAMKPMDEALPAGEPEEEKQQMPIAPTPPMSYSQASAPSVTPTPMRTATIDRSPAPPASAIPEIPEVEDYLPILRRRVSPPPIPIPEAPKATVEEKPAPMPVIQRQERPQRMLFPTDLEPTASPARPAPAKPQVQAPVPTPVPVKPQAKPVEPPAQVVAEGSQDMWERLPRHVQLLVGLNPSEVAQRSYKQFKETRDQLVERLLDPTLSLEDTARILNVCPTTVRRYTNKDLLKHLRTAGNQRRFRLSDVLTFMESQAGKKAD